MLENNNESKAHIKEHNDTTPKYRVEYIKKILNGFCPKKIFDLGCGLGFTTNELKVAFPNAEVIGIDISRDGIEYGKKIFLNVSSLQKQSTQKIRAKKLMLIWCLHLNFILLLGQNHLMITSYI